MTWHLFFILLGAAGLLTLGFIPGHHYGRRSCRNEYPDGWDQGQAAERERWEKATGTTLGALAGWNRDRPQDAAEWEAWAQTGEPPSKEALFAEAERLAAYEQPVIHKFEGQVSEQELDEWKARWETANARAPVVADITTAGRWRPPGMQEPPTVEGVVVAPRPAPRSAAEADWEVLAAFPDYVYADNALGGHRTVDELVDSMVRRARR